MHPAVLPVSVGFSSENAAHRFAIMFTDSDGVERQGVYIPQRHTNSALTHALGRIVPGVHQAASFSVQDEHGRIDLRAAAHDGEMSLHVLGKQVDSWPVDSIFTDLAESSQFFESGALGLSDSVNPNEYDQVELVVEGWQVHPFEVEQVESSYFSDERLFPTGTVTFDHALVMRNIRHEWQSRARFKTSVL
jgi:hypothetical protein